MVKILKDILIINFRTIDGDSKYFQEYLNNIANSILDFLTDSIFNSIIDLYTCDVDIDKLSEEEYQELIDRATKELDIKATIDIDYYGNMIVHVKMNDHILREKAKKCELEEDIYYELIKHPTIELLLQLKQRSKTLN